MPQPFQWINGSNVTGFESLAAYDNLVTNGYYAPVLILTIFLIVLFVSSNRRGVNPFMVASFFAAISGAFLWILGLLAWYFEATCIAALVASVVLLSRE